MPEIINPNRKEEVDKVAADRIRRGMDKAKCAACFHSYKVTLPGAKSPSRVCREGPPQHTFIMDRQGGMTIAEVPRVVDEMYFCHRFKTDQL